MKASVRREAIRLLKLAPQEGSIIAAYLRLNDVSTSALDVAIETRRKAAEGLGGKDHEFSALSCELAVECLAATEVDERDSTSDWARTVIDFSDSTGQSCHEYEFAARRIVELEDGITQALEVPPDCEHIEDLLTHIRDRLRELLP